MKNKINDPIEYKVLWTIKRWRSRKEWEENKPFSISEIHQNGLLNEGINELFTIICSSGGTKWDAANAYLGVGDGTTAFSATQTGLQGTNKTYKGMDAGYPTFGTNQKATWKATFMETEANHGWQEFTIANGNSDAAKNLNRKVSNQGTKVAGQIWELTLEISLS
jgi:hypothetical protein